MALLIGDSWRDKLLIALHEVTALQSKYPGDIALLSAARQLSYLIALADSVENDDTALEEITLGYIAMYQLQDVASADLAELLSEINGRVRRYLRLNGRRLKIDR
jgi:hypothetical protein